MKSTLHYRLFYDFRCHIQVHGYTDVDWDGSISDKRSTSSSMFSLGSAAIFWSSTKQLTIALLSTKAKYRV